MDVSSGDINEGSEFIWVLIVNFLKFSPQALLEGDSCKVNESQYVALFVVSG